MNRCAVFASALCACVDKCGTPGRERKRRHARGSPCTRLTGRRFAGNARHSSLLSATRQAGGGTAVRREPGNACLCCAACFNSWIGGWMTQESRSSAAPGDARNKSFLIGWSRCVTIWASLPGTRRRPCRIFGSRRRAFPASSAIRPTICGHLRGGLRVIAFGNARAGDGRILEREFDRLRALVN